MNGKTNASDITVNQIVNGVLIPLEPATDFKIGSGSGRAYFTWTDPVDKYTTPGDELVSQWEKSVVVRKKDSVPSNIDDGTVVLTETVRNQYQTNQYIDETVDDDTTYYYSVYPVTTTDLVSDSIGGVAVIPMGGEPGFKAILDNLFTISKHDYSLYSLCAGSNNSIAVIVEYNVRRDYTGKTHFIDLDLTHHDGTGINQDGDPAVGELKDYVIFNEAYFGSDNVPSDWTFAYNNDMSRISLPVHLYKTLGKSVTNPSKQVVMFAGSSGYQYSGHKYIQIVNNDLTVQTINEQLDQVHFRMSGTYVGSYYLYGNGKTSSSTTSYNDTTMYAFDNDYTRIINVDPMTLLGNSGWAYQVDAYGIFTSYQSKYFEAWDSNLTHIPYTSYAQQLNTILSDILEGSTVYDLSYGDVDRTMNYQYGNYAMLPFSTYTSSPAGISDLMCDIIMINPDMSITRRHLTDFSDNVADITYDPLTILDDMYIYYTSNSNTRTIGLFVLSI